MTTIEDAAKLLDRGDVERGMEGFADARAQYERALKLFREIADRGGEAKAMIRLGWMVLVDCVLYANLAAASDDWDEWAARSPKYADYNAEHPEALDDSKLTISKIKRGVQVGLDNGQTLFEQALQRFRELADKSGEAEALDGLGMVANERGLLSDAYAFLNSAYNICLEINDRVALAYVLWHAGRVLRQQNQTSEAQAAFEAARAHFQSVGLPDEASGAERELRGEEQEHRWPRWLWPRHRS